MEKIDFTYLEVLSENDEDFKTEFIETFEGTYTELLRKMKECLENNDSNQLSKAAHQLKPSAKMLALPCSATLEDLQHHPEKASAELLDAIEKECETALALLKSWANK